MRGRTARRLAAERWIRRERKARPEGRMPVFWVRSEYARYWRLHGPKKAPGRTERLRILERRARDYLDYARLVYELQDKGLVDES